LGKGNKVRCDERLGVLVGDFEPACRTQILKLRLPNLTILALDISLNDLAQRLGRLLLDGGRKSVGLIEFPFLTLHPCFGVGLFVEGLREAEDSLAALLASDLGSVGGASVFPFAFDDLSHG